MAKGINEKITSIETPWEGYTGARVEEFIKEEVTKLDSEKVGYIYDNAIDGRVHFYATKNDFTSGKESIGSVLSTARYTMELMEDVNNQKVFLSDDGKKEFVWYFKTSEIANNSLYAENVTVDYKITNQSEGDKTSYYSTIITSNADAENSNYTKVVLNLDEYLTNGTSIIEINVTGLKTKQERTLSTKISIITLEMEDSTNFSSPIENNFIITLNVACTKGQTFFYEYRLDETGDFIIGSNRNGTGISEKIDYTLNVSTLTPGKHIFEYRLFVKLDDNTEPYYTSTQRIEFIKKGNLTTLEPQILIHSSYRNGDEVKLNGNLIINGISQYVPYSIKYAVYNPKAGSTNLEFREVINGELASPITKTISNFEFDNYDIQSIENGLKEINIITKDLDGNITNGNGRVIYLNVKESTLNISVYNTNLRVDFSSVGKSNDSVDKNIWNSVVDNPEGAHYNNIATFNEDYDWSQGWTENGLVISDGCEVTFDYAPFPHQKEGATEEANEYVGGDRGYSFEIEFMTQNVTNENVVVCDMMDETEGGKCGLQITGSEIRFTTPEGNSVSTRFKAEEMNRAVLVIRPKTTASGEFKGLVELYINGVLSNIAKYGSDEKFQVFSKDENNNAVSKKLSFKGVDGADIVVKHIRTYNGVMEGDDVVNNYILYRTKSKEMLNLYNKNNVLNEQGVITPESIIKLGNIPVLIFIGRTNEQELATGDGNEGDGKGNCYEDYMPGEKGVNEENWYQTLENTTDKKKNVDMDVIYYNPLDKTKNFKFVKAYITPQGTSSMYYPKKNYRIYTQKNKDTRVFLSTGSAGVLELNQMLTPNFGEKPEDRLYEFWRGKANYKKRKYSFKDNAQPVKCWCLKADFAETSSSHNTGVARLWGDTLKNSEVTIDNTDITVFKTNAQARTEVIYNNNINGDMPDVRTTIDGFPIVVFGAKSYSDEIVFLGQYNFNNDKSTESVFGFCDIDDEYKYTDAGLNNDDNVETDVEHTLDNMLDKYMTCVETLDNGNALANFSTMNEFDSKWDDAFEFRYPEIPEAPKEKDYKDSNENWKEGGKEEYEKDTAKYEEELEYWKHTHLKPFKHFAEWIYSTRWCDVNGDILEGITPEEAQLRKEKFAKEKWDHLDVWKMAAYYIYAMRFGAVDQIVKNSMLTSEGPFAYNKDGNKYGYWDTTDVASENYGKYYKWYYINYDNDTILGVKNDGSLAYGPEITRKMKEGSGSTASYIYAGSTSTLWNNFDTDEEFQNIVRIADQGISKTMTYKKAIEMFDVEQVGQWCERIYNKDADYKYVNPYVADWKYTGEDEKVENFSDKLFMLQGSRTAHRRWWMSKRFNLFDGKWNSGEFATKFVEVKCDYGSIGDTFGAVAGSNAYFGYQINNKTFGDGAKDGGTSYEYQAGDNIDWKLYKNIQIGDPIAIYGSTDMLELNLTGLSKNLSSIAFKFGSNKDLSNKLERLIISVPDELLLANSSYKIYSDDEEGTVNFKTAFQKLKIDYPEILESDFEANGKYPTSENEFDAADVNSPDFYRTLIVTEDGANIYTYFVKVKGGVRNYSCKTMSFNDLDKLQVLKMAGYSSISNINLETNKFINEVDVRYADALNTVTFATGSRIKEFKAPKSLTTLKFNSCGNITLPNIIFDSETLENDGGKNLNTIYVEDSDGLNHDNNFKKLILSWIKGGNGYKANSDRELTLKGVKWTGITIEDIKNILTFIYGEGEYGGLWINPENDYSDMKGSNRARLCNISGTIKMSNENLSRESINLIDKLRYYTQGIDIKVEIPTNVLISIPESIVAGEIIPVKCELFPSEAHIQENNGVVSYSFVKEVEDGTQAGVLFDSNTGKYYMKIDDTSIRNGSVELKTKGKYEAELNTSEIICDEDTRVLLAVFLNIGALTKFDIAPMVIKDPTYAVKAIIEGDTSINELGTNYIYNLILTSNKNSEPIGSINIEWNLSNIVGDELGNGLDFIASSSVSPDNKTLTITTHSTNTPVEDDGTPKIAKFNINVFVDNLGEGKFKDLPLLKQVTVLNENIIMTKETNEVVLDICHRSFNTASEEYLTKDEAANINDISTYFANEKRSFSFNELKYFTGLTSLTDGAFANSNVTAITIPNNVTELGKGVFENCTVLTDVELPNKLLEIPEKCFLNCSSLGDLYLPDTVMSIFKNAFGGVGFTEIIFRENARVSNAKTLYIGSASDITTIQNDAFETSTWSVESLDNKLEIISLPSKIAFGLGEFNFMLAKNLNSVIVANDSANATFENNIVYGVKDKTVIVRALANVPEELFVDEIELNNVTDVYRYAFYNCNSIGKISFGSGLKGTGLGEGGTFYGSSISEVNLEGATNLNELREYTFYDMPNLSSVKLPGKLTTLGHHLFGNCPSLTELIIPDSVTTLKTITTASTEAYTFVNCGFINLELPDSMASGSSITRIVSNCEKLETLKLPAFIKNTDKVNVVTDCINLREITLPVFTYTYTTGEEIIVNTSLKLGDTSFIYNCPKLSKYKLSILDNGKYYIENENGALYQQGDIVNNNIETLDAIRLVAVPFAANDSSLYLLNEMDIIGRGAFARTNITNLVLPDNVRKIEADAFMECSKLKNVILSETLKEMGTAVFRGCSSLTELKLPSSIKKLEQYALYSCISLEKLELLAVDFEYIDWFALCGCNKLSALILHNEIAPEVKTSNEYYVDIFNPSNNDIFKFHPFGYDENTIVGKSSGKDNILYIPYNNEGYDVERWIMPLQSDKYCKFKTSFITLNSVVELSGTLVEEYDILYFKSQSGNFVNDNKVESVPKFEGVFTIQFNNKVYDNEVIDVYSNETCSDSSYIGSFVAKCYKDKYELDNNILGSTKSNSMFKSNIFSSGIVKNDDDNIVTITKKEYDILQSKINQLMKLINMKK